MKDVAEDKEINLWEYWCLLWGAKKFVILMTMICTIAAIVISLLWPKTFRAEAVIMPLGGQKSGGGLSAAVAQMGLGGLLGGIGGASSNSAQIMAILKSRTLAERVIKRYDLLPLLFEGGWDASSSRWITENPPNLEEAVRRFSLLLETMDDKKSQTIKIAAQSPHPEAAALIVNGLLTELYKDINENAFTVQKRNRIFIEGQLERNKQDLLEVGKELSSFYATNRVSDSRSQIDVDVKQSMGQLPESGPVSAVKSLPPSLSGIDIPVMPQDLQEQVDTLRQKIEEAKVVRDVPQQVYLQYLTMRQELMARMNGLLTQQYEMAKIEESKEDLSFQVIDWARVPVKKFKPKRAQIVITAFVLSGFFSVFYVFAADYFRKMKNAEA